MSRRNPHGAETGEGLLRIAAVAEVTGVAEPTLRAWERRYGVPTPQRTPSGYRLYGEAEVAEVREMKRLCEAGMAAAEAARAVRSPKERKAPSRRLAIVDPYADAVAALVSAAARLDSAAMDEELRRAMFLGSAVEIAERVLCPALVTVGDLWHQGKVTVAEEHFATHKIGDVLRGLVRLVTAPGPGRTVVLASFADEDHEIGLLTVALRLALTDNRPVFLGARTPPSAVRRAVDSLGAAAVCLSVTKPPAPLRARELLEGYAAACGRVPWVVGGPGAGAMAEVIATCGGLVAGGAAEVVALLVAAEGGGVATRSKGRS